MKKFLPALTVLLLFIAGACKKNKTIEAPVPASATATVKKIEITAINPASGKTGSIVTITGNNFGTSANDVTVTFNGVNATVSTVTDTEIKVIAPTASTGNIVVNKATQTVQGEVFTYVSADLPGAYTDGNVLLSSQAEIDAFINANKAKTLQITGDLTIGSLPGSTIPNNITSVAGFPNITSISGNTVLNQLQLSEVPFLNKLTATGIIAISYCNFTSLDFSNLKSVINKNSKPLTGPSFENSIAITNCPLLTKINFNSLVSVEGEVLLSGTGIKDMSGFGFLKSVGGLEVSNNPQLTSFQGLEALTTFSLPAMTHFFTRPYIKGLVITGNSKLTTLAGLQGISSLPLAYITNNVQLNDFCLLKTQLLQLSKSPIFSFTTSSPVTFFNDTCMCYPNSSTTVSKSTFELTNNGSFITTQATLDGIVLCK